MREDVDVLLDDEKGVRDGIHGGTGDKGTEKDGEREREREREGGRKRHSRIHSSEDVMCWSHVRRCDPRYSDGERKGSARGVADLRGRESHRVAVT